MPELVTAPGIPGPRDPAPWLVGSEVNKGSINMTAFTATMNRRWENGWRLAHVFERDKNTVMVWERRG